ncbi:hypothetical protein M8C21_023543 [Ambrosia artemisiifolia]|uniref:Ubiquinol-cytochrome c chaperone domain-containing protein n=1 Tax=Ambrosia artemisiifolia TaxID=4212 RepID=A0AAD5CV62_AMBAR|nr:hypothetical protein M8C21_023543 [Ambrosia artemisiifolia]
MVPGWSRTLVNMYRVGKQRNLGSSYRSISRVSIDSMGKSYANISEGQGLEQLVNLNKMFRTKPVTLALPLRSPQRINEPNYKGVRLFILRLMLFYSKESVSIRAANVIYRRVVSQVENPMVYDVFRLEKTFRTTFSLLVVHMWLCLRRLKLEGKEGVELGQYVYEIYNHDLEIRVSKAGVNLLLSKWMRELEKVFYGNIVAYDTAMLPEAKPDELYNTIWKNVFSNDGSPAFDAAALPAVLASSHLDKESMFSGNFMFTTIYNPNTPG